MEEIIIDVEDLLLGIKHMTEEERKKCFDLLTEALEQNIISMLDYYKICEVFAELENK